MCRCKNAVTNAVKQKVSLFCHVPPEQVRNVGVGVNISIYVIKFRFLDCRVHVL